MAIIIFTKLANAFNIGYNFCIPDGGDNKKSDEMPTPIY